MKYQAIPLDNNEINTDNEHSILQDYLAFFTTENGVDMLPYAYMESSGYYNNIIKNNPDYYLFSEEVQIIKENKNLISQYLNEVSEVIEIGPGSNYAIENKTLPLLSYVKDIETYSMIDISENYLKDAYKFIKCHVPNNLKISAIQADLLKNNNFNIGGSSYDKRCILFLGSTLGNFNNIDQKKIIKQVTNLTNINDMLILTVDTNQDEGSLLKAYANEYNEKFLMNIFEFFVRMNPCFVPYISAFKIQCRWNSILKLVHTSFVAKDSLSFNFKDYGIVKISKGQEIHGIRSRKFCPPNLIKLLEESKFRMLDNIGVSNRVKLFIFQRI